MRHTTIYLTLKLTLSLSGRSCLSSTGTHACTLLSRQQECKDILLYTAICLRDQQYSDYSSLPIFKTITSASGEGIHQLTRFWVYDNVSQTDCDGFPFLLINGGGATLSGSMFGAAIVRDTITRREIQLLEHTGICRVVPFLRSLTFVAEIAGRHLSIMVRPRST